MKTDPKNSNASRAPSHPELSTDTNIAHSGDVHAEITAQIIEMLEAGVAPWRSGILGATKEPQNFDSKKSYRGVNNFLLSFRAFKQGYSSPFWMTFRQALAHGGNVRKGEKACMVVFWKQTALRDETTGETVNVPMLRRYHVFNLEQCDGIALPAGEPLPDIPFHPIAEAQRIVAGYAHGPAIEHKGFYAFYRPATDTVRIPEPEQFAGATDYYATLFHELAHNADSRIMPRRVEIPRKTLANCGRCAA